MSGAIPPDLEVAVRRIKRGDGHPRLQRIRVLAAALDPSSSPETPMEVVSSLASSFETPTPERVWLALAVLGDSLPTAGDTRAALLRVEVDGVWSVTGPLLRRLLKGPGWLRDRVEVETSAVLVDLQHTSQTHLATGIQRVAREVSRRWVDNDSVILVGWDGRERWLRRLAPEDEARGLGLPNASVRSSSGDVRLVPFRSTYLLPELAVEPSRTSRIQALAQYSGCTTGVLGFDCVPITSAETAAPGMGGAFAGNLAAVRYMTRVATISKSAATEYRGWRRMLRGAGSDGPEIREVPLPVEAAPPDPGAEETARSRFAVGDLPLVLCVGSHEPRKNHLAVLHASELLWREGLGFSLSFVGGNAWRDNEFRDRLRELQDAGRPVQSVTSVSDSLLWGAYRLARVVVFPSLNEGFGLPAAEALACGTPVVTSAFGSMREIGQDGGALLVDPRDDSAIADALRATLTDGHLYAELVDAARLRPTRTWDTYAHETWQFLVHGR